MEQTGMVYLVGAGPGNPDLITKKGLWCLNQCDVVVYDYLACEALLDETKEGCKKIYVGKRAGHHSMEQGEINEILVNEAKAGQMVVRLKGGDPFVFGRGGEEVLRLQEEGIAYEVVSGVTSAIAALASAGIPITHRGISRSFHVMTGHIMESNLGTLEGKEYLPDDFEAFCKLTGTLVFLMGLGNLEVIVDGLLRGGKPKHLPCAVIENGTMSHQRVVRSTLEQIVLEVKKEAIGSPAIVVAGDVVALDMATRGFYPLKGVCVGVTGTQVFTDKLGDLLKQKGANVSMVSQLCVKDYTKQEGFLELLNQLSQYDWLILTSANAVRLFFRGLLEVGLDYRSVSHMRFAVVGKGTKEELKQIGFLADYMPEVFSVEALASGMKSLLTTQNRVLIPRSSGGSGALTKMLTKKGIDYWDFILYDVVASPTKRQPLSEMLKSLDYLTFASASGVNAFFTGLTEEEKEVLNQLKVVCIGDITGEALKEQGREADLIGAPFSISGMVRAICEHER